MALRSQDVAAEDEWEIVPARTYGWTFNPVLLDCLDVDTTPFLTMLNLLGGRVPTSQRDLGFDPKLTPGQILFTHDGRLAGRVVRVTTNENRDDWLSVATVWTVWYDKPWHQSDVMTAAGATKIEWLEDELFPRRGVIQKDNGIFRKGDDVMIVGTRQSPVARKPDWRRFFLR